MIQPRSHSDREYGVGWKWSESQVVGHTGEFRWTPAADQAGEYIVRLRVTDLTGATDEQVATITVAESNRAPTAISLSNAAVAENFAGATVGQVQVTDPDVNQDGFVAPLDVLKIFNALNAQAGAGEAASTTPMAFESAEGTPQASDADCDSLFSDVETLEWVLTSANWSPATWADWDPERRKRAS